MSSPQGSDRVAVPWLVGPVATAILRLGRETLCVNQHKHGYSITFLEVDDIRSGANHNAHSLVTGNEGRGGLDRPVTVRSVNVVWHKPEVSTCTTTSP